MLIVRTVVDMPDFTTAAVAMVGIGVGIDYALFIVTRYRENLAAGLDPERSVVRAIDTAGRAVLFAGTTVVISVLGLLLMKTSIMRGVAIGISIGVLTTMLASVTLLPGAARVRRPQHRQVRPPAPQASRGRDQGVGLVPLEPRDPAPPVAGGDPRARCSCSCSSVPLLSMRLGFADAGNRPTADTTRRAYDLVAEGFGAGLQRPTAARGRDPRRRGRPRRRSTSSRATLNDTEGVAFATPPQPNEEGTVAVMQVFPTTDPQDEATADLVNRLRDDVIPSVTKATGSR